jgi:Ankyrin repeats (3 copies)
LFAVGISSSNGLVSFAWWQITKTLALLGRKISLEFVILCLLANKCHAATTETNADWQTTDSKSARTDRTRTVSTEGLLALIQNSSQPLTPVYRTNLCLLLAAGANLEEKDADRRTSLILAVVRGDIDTVRLLVEAGANIKARDRFHKTALFYATDAGRRDIVDYLASNGDLQSPTPRERKERNRR